MEELHECLHCGKQSSDDKDLQTDIDICQDEDDLTCEECYDKFNE